VKKRKTAREIADEVMTADEAKNFAKDPKLTDLENRAIKALQRTRNYLLEGLSDEEYKDIGDEGIEELAGDCHLERDGGDNEACHWFWSLTREEQDELTNRAFNRRKQ
jgi:hypothetical protein